MQTLLESFLLAKQSAELSPRTLRWYAGILTGWWVSHPQINSTAGAVETYLAELRRRGLAPASVAGHWRALSVWFAWLVETGAVPVSPLAHVKRPKAPQKRIAYVTPAEIDALAASLAQEPSGCDWSSARDRALALLLFYSGLRVSEALALQVDHVDIGRRLLFVERGKGGTPRISPFAGEVVPALLEYLYRRPPSPYRHLWLANDGIGNVRGVLTDNGVRQMLRRRCKAAGVRYLNPHAFRHGYAMWTLNSGMELSAVSAAMGHSSTQITQHTYARWLPDAIQREYDDAATQMRKGRTRS